MFERVSAKTKNNIDNLFLVEKEQKSNEEEERDIVIAEFRKEMDVAYQKADRFIRKQH